MKNRKITSIVLILISIILGIRPGTCGESSGSWPSSLIHPLTGKAGGTYSAVAEGTFMDSKYNNGVAKELWREHVGTDIAASNGSKVYAVADGTGIYTAGSGKDACVVVTHKVGKVTFLAIYGHVTKTRSGSTIKKGEVLGKVLDYGKTGSSGDHLHFGVFEGTKYPTWVNGKEWGWGKVPVGTKESTVNNYGWRDPVPFLRGLKADSPALIEVSGFDTIENGDTSASTSDGTYLKGGKNKTLRFVFVIRNTGSSPLTISSCSLKDADKGFVITRTPKTTISPGTYSTLEIEFRSSKFSYNYADVEILSNSEKDSNFRFEIKTRI
jgi:murein DD-endopeptidase MepM/ murein hydrolase activator NlpD